MKRRRQSGFKDVANRIMRKIRNNIVVKELIEKVQSYLKTKSENSDLTLQESAMIYRDIDLDEEVNLNKKRKLEIDWTNHAKYRSELRDIDPKEVNNTIEEKMKEKLEKNSPKKRGKDVFKEPGIGHIVLDYDLLKNPADARVITVYAKVTNRLFLEGIKKWM